MNYNLELSMRPGRLSMGGFLGKNEKLDEVLRADDETVRGLGLTHDQIADRIEYFIQATMFYPSEDGDVVDGKYLVGGEAYRGGQDCPWGDVCFMMPYSNMELFVRNQQQGERLDFPGAIVHLIREHHFYEGRQSPYRVDPWRAVKILDVK